MGRLAIPAIIESKAEYEAALNTLSDLASKGADRKGDEDKLFRTWIVLVEEYEQRTRERNPRKLSVYDLLQFLLAENGLGPKSFEPKIGQSRMSEILSGSSQISNAHAVLLAKRFHVKPSVFLSVK
jgi:antitoxin component HigA of HigAB toxin-antitoxin module